MMVELVLQIRLQQLFDVLSFIEGQVVNTIVHKQLFTENTKGASGRRQVCVLIQGDILLRVESSRALMQNNTRSS